MRHPRIELEVCRSARFATVVHGGNEKIGLLGHEGDVIDIVVQTGTRITEKRIRDGKGVKAGIKGSKTAFQVGANRAVD